MTKLSVVIAAYNEQENIEPLLRRLHATLNAVPAWTWEMLFVVEGRDRTREILEQLAAELGGDIRVLYNEEPSGLGNAFRRGFAAVAPDADLVLTLDADLNHQPEEIPRLIERLRESRADIVVGSRFLEGSKVEGTPLWKRFLSGVMNFFMRYLYGLRVLDKTSGFRVYQAEALRALEFRNQAFAFLPEMLIRAHNLGLTIVEEPIHFIFRREGKSKLDFWSTSWSYLTLLGTRVDRWSLIAGGLIAAGLLVRAAAVPPVSPGALILLGLGVLLLVFEHRFVRALYGRRIACLALLFLALPPPAFLLWTSIPGRTLPALALGALSLWLAAWVAGDPTERMAAFVLGIVGGLAFWRWPLALACFVPALVWLLVARPRVRQSAGVFLILAGLVVGAWPLILGDRPAEPLLEGGAWMGWDFLVAKRLPELFAAPDPAVGGGGGILGLTRVLRWPVLAIHVLAALFFLGLPWLRRPARLGPGLGRWAPWALILGVAATVVAVDLRAASPSDLRYILPLSLLAPVMLALFLAAVGRWSRLAAAALAGCILVFAVAGYPWP